MESNVVEINGKRYEASEEVAKEIERLRKIATSAELTDLILAKVVVLLRSITRETARG